MFNKLQALRQAIRYQRSLPRILEIHEIFKYQKDTESIGKVFVRWG